MSSNIRGLEFFKYAPYHNYSHPVYFQNYDNTDPTTVLDTCYSNTMWSTTSLPRLQTAPVTS